VIAARVEVPPRALLYEGRVSAVQVPRVRSIRVGQLMQWGVISTENYVKKRERADLYLSCGGLTLIHPFPECQALVREALACGAAHYGA
jgi:hypothetical protein